MIELDTIYNEDCIEGMKRMGDAKSTTKAQEWISSHEYIELPNSKIVNK